MSLCFYACLLVRHTIFFSCPKNAMQYETCNFKKAIVTLEALAQLLHFQLLTIFEEEKNQTRIFGYLEYSILLIVNVFSYISQIQLDKPTPTVLTKVQITSNKTIDYVSFQDSSCIVYPSTTWQSFSCSFFMHYPVMSVAKTFFMISSLDKFASPIFFPFLSLIHSLYRISLV